MAGTLVIYRRWLTDQPISSLSPKLNKLRPNLVRRAEAGEEIVLTRHGKPAVRLEVAEAPEKHTDWEARLRAIEKSSAEAKRKAKPGPPAARAADFLYDERGLPK